MPGIRKLEMIASNLLPSRKTSSLSAPDPAAMNTRQPPKKTGVRKKPQRRFKWASIRIVVDRHVCQEVIACLSAQDYCHSGHLLKQDVEAAIILLFRQISIINTEISNCP